MTRKTEAREIEAGSADHRSISRRPLPLPAISCRGSLQLLPRPRSPVSGRAFAYCSFGSIFAFTSSGEDDARTYRRRVAAGEIYLPFVAQYVLAGEGCGVRAFRVSVDYRRVSALHRAVGGDADVVLGVGVVRLKLVAVAESVVVPDEVAGYLAFFKARDVSARPCRCVPAPRACGRSRSPAGGSSRSRR